MSDFTLHRIPACRQSFERVRNFRSNGPQPERRSAAALPPATVRKSNDSTRKAAAARAVISPQSRHFASSQSK
eukprot:6402742-Prymnesium_polylepis.1